MTKRKAADVRNAIKTVIASAGQLQTQIHELGLECLEHAEEHGDVTLADLMVKELPKGQRVEALKVWFETFSPIRWNGKGEVGQLKKEAKNYTPYDLEAAAATPYYSLTQEKKPQTLSLENLINIVQGLEKRIDKAEENGAIADGESVDAMRTYVKNLTSVKLPAKVDNDNNTTTTTEDGNTITNENDGVIEYEDDDAGEQAAVA